MSVETWLGDTSTEPPCGPSLEYDPEFLALASLAAGKPEQQYGDTVIPAEEPDWRQLETLAEALLGRSKDVRFIVQLARARTHNAGLPGTAEVVRFLRELLDRRWEAVHPLLAVDGELDPFLRVNAVSALADIDGLVRDVRGAEVFRSTLGTLTFRAIERILSGSAAEPQDITGDQLRAALRDALEAGQEAPRAIPAIVDDLRAISAMFRDRLGNESVPDIGPLLLPMETLGKLVSSLMPKPPGEEPAQREAEAVQAPVAAPAGAAMVVGAIRDRESALRALDSVCEFLERSEPTNPAPMLIRRAQRLMTMSFIDIIRELAPESVAQVEVIAGTKEG